MLKSSLFENNSQSCRFEELNKKIFILENELKSKMNALEVLKRKQTANLVVIEPSEALLELNNERIVLKMELFKKENQIEELLEKIAKKEKNEYVVS